MDTFKPEQSMQSNLRHPPSTVFEKTERCFTNTNRTDENQQGMSLTYGNVAGTLENNCRVLKKGSKEGS